VKTAALVIDATYCKQRKAGRHETKEWMVAAVVDQLKPDYIQIDC